MFHIRGKIDNLEDWPNCRENELNSLFVDCELPEGTLLLRAIVTSVAWPLTMTSVLLTEDF